MGDYWMTSGKARLKALERNGRKRGRNVNGSSGRAGGASLQMPFPPSTQPPNHPLRPRSTSEFLGGRKGHVDPFTMRGVIGEVRRHPSPTSTEYYHYNGHQPDGMMVAAARVNGSYSTLPFRRIRHPTYTQNAAGIRTLPRSRSRIAPPLSTRVRQHPPVNMAGPTLPSIMPPDCARYQEVRPFGVAGGGGGFVSQQSSWSSQSLSDWSQQRQQPEMATSSYSPMGGGGGNRGILHTLTQQHNSLAPPLPPPMNAGGRPPQHLYPPSQPWLQQQEYEDDEEAEARSLDYQENSFETKWGGLKPPQHRMSSSPLPPPPARPPHFSQQSPMPPYLGPMMTMQQQQLPLFQNRGIPRFQQRPKPCMENPPDEYDTLFGAMNSDGADGGDNNDEEFSQQPIQQHNNHNALFFETQVTLSHTEPPFREHKENVPFASSAEGSFRGGVDSLSSPPRATRSLPGRFVTINPLQKRPWESFLSSSKPQCLQAETGAPLSRYKESHDSPSPIFPAAQGTDSISTLGTNSATASCQTQQPQQQIQDFSELPRGNSYSRRSEAFGGINQQQTNGQDHLQFVGGGGDDGGRGIARFKNRKSFQRLPQEQEPETHDFQAQAQQNQLRGQQQMHPEAAAHEGRQSLTLVQSAPTRNTSSLTYQTYRAPNEKERQNQPAPAVQSSNQREKAPAHPNDHEQPPHKAYEGQDHQQCVDGSFAEEDGPTHPMERDVSYQRPLWLRCFRDGVEVDLHGEPLRRTVAAPGAKTPVPESHTTTWSEEAATSPEEQSTPEPGATSGDERQAQTPASPKLSHNKDETKESGPLDSESASPKLSPLRAAQYKLFASSSSQSSCSSSSSSESSKEKVRNKGKGSNKKPKKASAAAPLAAKYEYEEDDFGSLSSSDILDGKSLWGT